MHTPNSPAKFSVDSVNWQTHQQALKQLRERVFIQEQNVPVKLEWDGLDAQAIHILAIDNDKQAIGTARILLSEKHAHIGRMAVLPEWRRQGVGSAILACCLEQCRKYQQEKIILNALHETSTILFLRHNHRKSSFLLVIF